MSKYKSIAISMRAKRKDDLMEWLKRQAQKQDITVSAFILELLEDYKRQIEADG